MSRRIRRWSQDVVLRCSRRWAALAWYITNILQIELSLVRPSGGDLKILGQLFNVSPPSLLLRPVKVITTAEDIDELVVVSQELVGDGALHGAHLEKPYLNFLVAPSPSQVLSADTGSPPARNRLITQGSPPSTGWLIDDAAGSSTGVVRIRSDETKRCAMGRVSARPLCDDRYRLRRLVRLVCLTVTNMGGEFESAFRCVQIRPHLSQR